MGLSPEEIVIMHPPTFALGPALLVGLWFPLAPPTKAADDLKPTAVEELDELPLGLKVVHDPNPAQATQTGKSQRRGKYTWWFKTTVTSTGQDVKVVEFGAYAWRGGRWEFANFSAEPFSAKDFMEWYSCPDALIKAGKAYTDPTNWASAQELMTAKARWYYVGIDSKGRRVKGEAIIEQKGKIDPKRPKDTE
jgi:hypothetical protein